MMRPPLLIAGLVAGSIAVAPLAAADPTPAIDLDDIVAEVDAGHAAAVITELRPRLASLDDTGRCALGLAYAGPDRRGAKPDRARGLIYLASCGGGLPTAIAEHADHVRDRLVALAERAGDTQVELVASARLAVEIDRLAGDVALAPSTVWLPPGAYAFTAHAPDGALLVSERTLARRSTANVLFELPHTAPQTAPGPARADFTDGEPDATYVGPPPKQEHPSLIPDRFEKGLRANRELVDIPIMLPPPAVRRTIGIRLGTGLVRSGSGELVPMTFAAVVRQPVAGRLAIDGRVDVFRRGARMTTGTPGVWIVGAGAFARWWAVTGDSISVSAVGGLRAELRHVFDGDTDLGLTVGGGVALHLAGNRFAVELRGEQGLNELAGSRPQSLLVDLGFDL